MTYPSIQSPAVKCLGLHIEVLPICSMHTCSPMHLFIHTRVRMHLPALNYNSILASNHITQCVHIHHGFVEFLPPLLPGCLRPLGMQDGRIRDSAITASSYYRERSAPSRGRLHLAVPDPSIQSGVTGGWCQRFRQRQWLQVDFGYVASVGKVATQGKQEHDFWVTKYFLTYRRDVKSSGFLLYKQNGNAKVISISRIFSTLTDQRL